MSRRSLNTQPQNENEQPRVLGHADAVSLAGFLEGILGRTRLTAGHGVERPAGGSSNDAAEPLLAVLVLDEDADGYLIDTVSQLFVTTTPNRHHVVPGLFLWRDEGQWQGAPGFASEAELAKCDAVLIQTDWISALHRLAWAELEPLLRLPQNLSRPPHALAVQEVEVRINAFGKHGATGFFDFRDDQLAWMIAAAWADWEDRGLPPAARIKELKEGVGLNFDSKEFAVICEKYGLAFRRKIKKIRRTKNREQETNLVALGESTAPQFDATKEELRLLRDYSPEADAEFSKGGAAELSFDLDSRIAGQVPVIGTIKTEGDLAESLWWWKGFFPDCSPSAKDLQFPVWDKELVELFQDNWERGAFFYEFRAREKPQRRWEPFERPWVKLNYTERGVLASLWPPLHTGRKRLTRNVHPFVLAHMPHKARLTAQIDLNMPEEDFLKWATEWFRDARQNAQSKGTPMKHAKQRMQRWAVLQSMDRAYYLNEKLDGTQRAAITQVRRSYEQACHEAALTL